MPSGSIAVQLVIRSVADLSMFIEQLMTYSPGVSGVNSIVAV
jgi:hypothetical protein